MRSRRRSAPGVVARTRGVPARSRMTVRRSDAPLVRSSQLADALRSGREALTDIQGQLDALLAVLRDPAATPDAVSAERLRGATRRAGSALASLGVLARRR